MKAVLVLETEKVFWGESFGIEGETLGEIVFNTGMCGYQEILTDPSYCDQIVTMTYPHIGNYGTNSEDFESAQSFVKGFVVRERSAVYSSWRADASLDWFLHKQNIVAIDGIDTRAVTLHIREAGAMTAIISTRDFDQKSLVRKIRSFPPMKGKDLVSVVKRKKTFEVAGTVRPDSKKLLHVVLIDYGCKSAIINALVRRGCTVTTVPPDRKADEIIALKPDGVMLSNGPGDPAAVTYAVETVKQLIRQLRKPIFGICLGHQIIGLAFGGRTYKLVFGHRGVNQPVKNLLTGRIEITSQNHGFNVDMASLQSGDIEITHINLNDQTVEGLRHRNLPVFSVQYHPEASPGPHDSAYLFDDFVSLMDEYRKERKER